MVPGGCGSTGCFAMTNPVVDEIWQSSPLRSGTVRRAFRSMSFPSALQTVTPGFVKPTRLKPVTNTDRLKLA